MFVIVFIWLCVLVACMHRRRVRLPGPPPHPLIGNMMLFFGSPQRVFHRTNAISKKYKRMAAIWLGPKLHLAVFNHRDAEVILRAKCTKKSNEYQFFKAWLGASILLSEGQRFKEQKKMLTVSFHPHNIKEFMSVFNKQVEQLTRELEDQLDGKEFDVYPHIALTTMRTFLETSLGITEKAMGININEYSRTIEILKEVAIKRIAKFWLRPDCIFNQTKLKKVQEKYVNVAQALADRMIAERKATVDQVQQDNENGKPRFLDNYLRATDNFTSDQIRDELIGMLFAGQDTTALSLSFSLCLLGLHQDVQSKVYEEITNVFALDQSITYEDCQSLQYLEQVIQETWRLYPPIPVIAKTLTDDISLDHNYTIPKGSTVALILMLIHRDEKVYPDPHRFNPDNFQRDRVRERSPYSFIPFSSGTRTCLGPRYAMQLMKVTLAIILRKFRVFSTKPEVKYKLAAEVSLKRFDAFEISLTRR